MVKLQKAWCLSSTGVPAECNTYFMMIGGMGKTPEAGEFVS